MRHAIAAIITVAALTPPALAVDWNRTVEIDVTAERELLIDPRQKAIDGKRAAWVEQRKSECPPMKKKMSYMEIEKHTECIFALEQRAAEVFPGRGTAAYAEEAYSGLTREQAQKKSNELYKKSFEMRDPSTLEERRTHGVVRRGDLRSEVLWLEQHKLGTKVLIGR